MVDFVIHWNETAMGLHVFPIRIPLPPPSPPAPSRFSQCTRSAACFLIGLFVCFWFWSAWAVCVFWKWIPPSSHGGKSWQMRRWVLTAMPLACHSVTMRCFYGAGASSTNFARVFVLFIPLFLFFLSSRLLWRYFSCPFRFPKSSAYVQQVLSENCPFCRCVLDRCICEARQTTHPPSLPSWLLPSSMIVNVFVWPRPF